MSYYTDPACPYSWAAEPALRRLQVEFAEGLTITYVMGGLAREFRKPLQTMRHVLDAAAESGMPTDPRLWLDAPPTSSYPACQAVKAAAEQSLDGPYLRTRAAARDEEQPGCRRPRVPFPSFEVRGEDEVHWVYDSTDPARLRRAALAAAELWGMAARWEVRPERALTGDLWAPA
ncbi:MAG: putative protein-disulfide isomerase [Solirubrobacteraceae bacterium]